MCNWEALALSASVRNRKWGIIKKWRLGDWLERTFGSVCCGHEDSPPGSPLNACSLCSWQPCQWTALNSQPLQGLSPHPGSCPFMHGQHPMTDQDGSVTTWRSPMRQLWWAAAPLGSPWSPLTWVGLQFNCTVCLVLL